jgi:hypothetical protein
MSVARHHAEWLSLIEASGPFLSMQVLLDVFPQGLEAHDSERFRILRQAYEEWLDSQAQSSPDKAIHYTWVKWVLQEILEYPDENLLEEQKIPNSWQVNVKEYSETLRPDWVLFDDEASRPRLLVQMVPANQDLEKTLANSRWKASPATRMMELLRGTEVKLGLVTNGDRWMLVHASAGETTSFISWYASLWLEEKVTLRAFRSLLGIERLLGVPEEETLEALFASSKNDQQEVTDQLGFQVREAVEMLVQAWDRIDQDRNRQLLQGMSDGELYEAALFVMMRLVFLLAAEERDLLLLGDPLYDQHYAVSTLRSQLREQADTWGEEVLERRNDAWCRLLATFRAVYWGMQHDRLQLPAYGGDLFDPDKFPFLEGREGNSSWKNQAANPIPINNRTVLHLLEALQILQVSVPGGGVEARRLSFRALDVEQIGHVYEGLLDHKAVRAESTVVGLVGTKQKEPEVPLADLEREWERGEEALVDFLQKKTGRSRSALRRSCPKNDAGAGERQNQKSSAKSEVDEDKLLVACGNDQELGKRVLPFAKLIRRDTFDYPLVIPEGSVYVTEGVQRRETGTHYTPRSLTEEVVRHALEPLVYVGVAEGKPKEDWQLKSAAEILQLKICDMAMGSGAFLVQVCRYLAARLVEAWEMVEKANPGKVVVAPEGKLSKSQPEECIIPADAEERSIVAKRIVAERCLYGVDKNPLAVEMAKLSLWLETLQFRKPFTFLDGALKCGDSLVGVSLEALRRWNLEGGEQQLAVGSDRIRQEVDEAIALRQQIESQPVYTLQDRNRKAYLLQEAKARTKDLRDRCNLLVASYLAEGNKKELDSLRENLLLVSQGKQDIQEGDRQRLPDLDTLRPFHWELEFPEVFALSSLKAASTKEEKDRCGFDAIVGNPPFMGGKKITGNLSKGYRKYLVGEIANNQRGNADICAYFFLRGQQLLNGKGNLALLATNTIAQGDTREVGLDQMVANGCTIYRAVSSRKWPGTASLEVAEVWLHRGDWQEEFVLDGKSVSGITPYLTVPGQVVGNPYRLAANQGFSFQGSTIVGNGFVLMPEEAHSLIKKDPRNRDVLYPYINGNDLNTNSDQSPSRWVINFHDWPLDPEHDDPKKPKGPPYAADYPDCLNIVEERVKPEREKDKRLREIWWLYWRRRPELYKAIAGRDRVLIRSRVSNINSIAFVPTGMVMSDATVVFNFDDYATFALLQSIVHTEWVNYNSSSMRTDVRYTPSDCFQTFPFPKTTDMLEEIGEKYYNHRQKIMQNRQEGLTKTYNRFHKPEENETDIEQLRQLQIEMDLAVAAAYGWNDLSLDHDFHETKQGTRFTISETARREILDRLLRLNHQRYAEEVKAGLHDKKKKQNKKKKSNKTTDKSQKSPSSSQQLGLL